VLALSLEVLLVLVLVVVVATVHHRTNHQATQQAVVLVVVLKVLSLLLIPMPMVHSIKVNSVTLLVSIHFNHKYPLLFMIIK
jgi:dTDP-4-dehydrorhamnose 3,5-epimerase-like enzyme